MNSIKTAPQNDPKANILLALLVLQAASIQDGELVWQGSYGLREFKSDKKVNDSTLFMIASFTKKGPPGTVNAESLRLC